jgi:hypothetical protein
VPDPAVSVRARPRPPRNEHANDDDDDGTDDDDALDVQLVRERADRPAAWSKRGRAAHIGSPAAGGSA